MGLFDLMRPSTSAGGLNESGARVGIKVGIKIRSSSPQIASHFDENTQHAIFLLTRSLYPIQNHLTPATIMHSNTLALLTLLQSLAFAQNGSPTPSAITIGSLSMPSLSISTPSISTGGFSMVLTGTDQTTMLTGSGQTTMITGNQCPSNQLNYADENGQYCCPGAVYGQGDGKYCCVGADFQVATPSFADCKH